MRKYLDYEGLQEFKGNLDSVLDPLKSKLDGVEEGATANEGTVTAVSVDGADYIPINGVVSLPNYPTTLPASDVSDWAKAQVKPSYSASEVGLDKVGNFKAVSTEASQGLTSTEQTNARTNIGAGTGTITGIKMNGASKGSSGVVDLGTVITAHQDISGKVDKTTTVNGHELSGNVTVTKSDVSLGNVTNDAQVKRTEMGVASGVATLDSAGKVPSSQLPSYVDDVLEYDTKSTFPETGEAGKIYVDKSTNTTWRWSGTAYTQIKGDLVIGTTTGTAADGGTASTHYSNTSNPHGVTKAQVGLGSVVNTGDSATPVSGGTTKFTTGGAYTELAKKVDKVSGKGLSTNDYTTDEKNKLSGIASGAQVNVIETVKVNGTALTSSSKAVNVTVPTKTSDLTNNSNFVSDASYVHTDNNYTATEKSKLSGIASGAEVNQNAFSNIGVKVGNTTTTVAADAKTDTVTLIQGSNVTLTADTTNDTVTIAAKDTTYSAATTSAAGLMSADDKTKLNGIAAGAEVNVQSDWNATSGDAFIKNKPTIPAAQVNSDWNATSGVAQILNKPTIPTVNNGKFSIKGAGTEVASTTANASSASSVDIVAGSNVTVTPDATNKKITIAANDTTYSVVSTSANGLAPKVTDTSKFLKGDGTWATPTDTNNRRSFYGTCDTAADTAAKAVTLSDTSGWELKAGTIVGIKFTNTNSASNVTLNVNSSGAKSIWYNNAAYTGSSNQICGYASRVTYYMYDGTYWVWLNMGCLDGNTDTKVAQTVTTTSANYEVLFSNTADNTTRTEGARKNSNLKFNPSTGNLQATQLNGVTIGSSPKFTDTTYSAMSVSEGTTGTATTARTVTAADLKGIIDARGYTTNTGTVTSVAVKMNGATKGTVTTSGTIDLGTVLTSHQDISGKADKTTTVNGHALSSNVTVTKSDVGLGNVTNDSQVKRSEMGAASGVATLDSNGKVPSSQLPSYVDDVIEAYYKAADGKFYTTLSSGTYSGAITGETGKIYVDLSTSRTYRWGGSAYAEIKASPGTLDDITDGSTYVRMTSAERTKLSGIATGATANTGTITKVGNTSSGAVTVSSSNNTASFGNAVTVGSVGGVDLKFTMPGNPNTNTWRPILIGGTDKLTDSSTKLNFAGSGATSISYSNGTVTISSTDNNTVTSINGKTGAIAAADIATVLTGAGYKLTDTNTWKAATTSQEGYVPTLALSGTSSGAKKDTINTQASDYVLTYTSGTETAPVWRKLPANAYANSTYTVNNGTFTVKGAGTAVSSTSANASGNTAVDFVAGSNVTITPDATNGKITISSTDTNTWRPVSDSVSSTSSTDAASSKAVKTAYDLAASKTSNTGTVTKVTAGTGLTGGDITTTGTIALATSGVTAGTYKRVTVDAYGRVTSGDNTDSDTKNTAGTTNKTGTKMFLAAATEQSANPVTYSNSNCYIGTDNCLYSGGNKVLTSYTNTTYAAGTGVTISGSNNAINVTYGTTANTACQGNDSRLSNSRPASDVYSWAKQSSKPSYGYGEISYSETSASVSGAVTVNGSTPVHVLTATGNISSISFTSGVPVSGHSCHIIITAASDYTAALAHGSTVTISGTTYTFKCPGAEDLSLDIKAGGFAELDLLRIGNNIYVRGV